jgi:hypothetical protein
MSIREKFMHGDICIPNQEYKDRVKKAAAILVREKLDALIVNSNEADYANARYFSGFWPEKNWSSIQYRRRNCEIISIKPQLRKP